MAETKKVPVQHGVEELNYGVCECGLDYSMHRTGPRTHGPSGRNGCNGWNPPYAWTPDFSEIAS